MLSRREAQGIAQQPISTLPATDLERLLKAEKVAAVLVYDDGSDDPETIVDPDPGACRLSRPRVREINGMREVTFRVAIALPDAPDETATVPVDADTPPPAATKTAPSDNDTAETDDGDNADDGEGVSVVPV